MATLTKQVRLPFEKLTEAGLKPIIKKFEKLGSKIEAIESTNKPRRESGFQLKDVTFVFSDGQKMLVRVKSDGTVFQVRLNKKVMPIKHVDDMDKAIREMVAYVQDNAKAYERARLQRERRRKLRIDPPAVTTNRQEKIQKAQADLAEITKTSDELVVQFEEKQGQAAALKARLEAALAELEAEREKTVTLEGELAELTGE